MPDMTYIQATGQFFIGVIELPTNGVTDGYSGYYNKRTGEDHRNIPENQCIPFRGPLPRGLYRMSDANGHKTKYSIWLHPIDTRVMCNRNSFMIHGGNKYGTASEGCIILMLENRKKVFAAMKNDGTTILEVK